jgi:hypothetical protein
MAVKTIRVPKTPPSAFNTQRPVSNLLKAQIANLEAATSGPTRAPAGRKRPRTEGQASALIRTLTAQLHPEGALASAGTVEARQLLQPPTAAARPRPKAVRRAKAKRVRRVGAKKR